jgi:hypothetical protein
VSLWHDPFFLPLARAANRPVLPPPGDFHWRGSVSLRSTPVFGPALSSCDKRGMMPVGVCWTSCPRHDSGCCAGLLNCHLNGEGLQRLRARLPRPVVDQSQIHLTRFHRLETQR